MLAGICMQGPLLLLSLICGAAGDEILLTKPGLVPERTAHALVNECWRVTVLVLQKLLSLRWIH